MSTRAGDDRPDGKRGGLTMRDIAALAGVSSKTVSLVVNRLPGVGPGTRGRVQDLITLHGYTPRAQAQGLATGRAFLLAHVFNNPNPEYVFVIQQGLLDGLEGTGHALVSFPMQRDDPQFLDRLRNFLDRHRVDGVVFTSSISEDRRLGPLMEAIGVPYVRVAAKAMDTGPRSVIAGDRAAAGVAAEHLYSLGHRRIGFVAGPQSFLSARERRSGFAHTLEELGAPLAPEAIREGDYTCASGLAAGTSLLAARQRPTAVFAANDEMAAGVMQAAQRSGLRVPDDLTVVGFDDFSIATRVLPHLTTVRIPTREMGELAALKLLGRAKATSCEAGQLVIRESSAPPPSRPATPFAGTSD